MRNKRMWMACAALLMINCLALAALVGLNRGRGGAREQADTPLPTTRVTAEPTAQPMPQPTAEQAAQPAVWFESPAAFVDMDWKRACAILVGEESVNQVKAQERNRHVEHRLKREDGLLFVVEPGRIAYWKNRAVLEYSQLFLDAIDSYQSEQSAARREIKRQALEQEPQGASRAWAARYARELVEALIEGSGYAVEPEQVAVFTVSQAKDIRERLRADGVDYIGALEDIGGDFVYRVRLRASYEGADCYAEWLDPMFQSGRETLDANGLEIRLLMTENGVLDLDIGSFFTPTNPTPVDVMAWEAVARQNKVTGDAGEPISIVLVSGSGQSAKYVMKPVYRLPVGGEALYFDAQTGERISRPVYTN